MSKPRSKMPKAGTVNLAKLPPMLRRLVRIVGEAPAYKLVERWGGTYIVLPVRPTQEHELAEMVGLQGLAAMIQEWPPGQPLQIPKPDSVLRQVRHERVRVLRAEGHTLKDTAMLTGYSIRQVISILDAANELGVVQLDMFNAQAEAAPAPVAGQAHNPFGL